MRNSSGKLTAILLAAAVLAMSGLGWLMAQEGVGGAAAPPPAAQAPAGPAAAPAEPPTRVEPIPDIAMAPEARKAIQRGLAYLAARQNLDGSWDTEYRRNTAVMSVALIAFLASGNPPGRGEYGVASARGLAYLLSCAKPSGMIVRDSSHGPMYEHALSTLYLAEVWGQTQQPQIKDKLKRAVEVIIQSQNQDGRWGYQPIPHGGDISVTVMQLMAIRAAHDAGIEVPAATIQQAIKFVNSCQNADGGFSYTGPPGPSNMPRTAAGVCSLQFAGDYSAAQVRKGLDYLLNAQKGDTSHFYYMSYYAMHAFYFAGGKYWQQWYPVAREQILAKQNPKNGSWGDHILDTGWAVLCLSIPHRYLPIYQR
ncbi:MAG: hypothetical protein BIFFINMI_00469 [Phycisphaerae bacterium]|nr:hypothetical protein [Phycisphaerae bacterium]